MSRRVFWKSKRHPGMTVKGLRRARLYGRTRVTANAKRKALYRASVGKARRGR